MSAGQLDGTQDIETIRKQGSESHAMKSEDDRLLRDNIRLLASTLGEVIRRLEGEPCFEAVESLRLACKARREREPGAPEFEQILARRLLIEKAFHVVVACYGDRSFGFFLSDNVAVEMIVNFRRAGELFDGGEPPGPCRR